MGLGFYSSAVCYQRSSESQDLIDWTLSFTSFLFIAYYICVIYISADIMSATHTHVLAFIDRVTFPRAQCDIFDHWTRLSLISKTWQMAYPNQTSNLYLFFFYVFLTPGSSCLPQWDQPFGPGPDGWNMGQRADLGHHGGHPVGSSPQHSPVQRGTDGSAAVQPVHLHSPHEHTHYFHPMYYLSYVCASRCVRVLLYVEEKWHTPLPLRVHFHKACLN